MISDKIRFGNIDWYVLDKQDDRMLIIAEKVNGKRAYHSQETEITWETCDVRKYLNGEFYDSYDSFNEIERAGIIEAVNENPDNPWDISNSGNIHIHGECTGGKGKNGGVRPALWLRPN